MFKYIRESLYLFMWITHDIRAACESLRANETNDILDLNTSRDGQR